MEEKIKQIQNYLTTKANPIVQPMLEQMAKERPDNVLPWMQSYINKKISKFIAYFRLTLKRLWLIILG